jgi:hypothetical protein
MTPTDALTPALFDCRVGGFLGRSYAVILAEDHLVHETFGAGYTPKGQQVVRPSDEDWEQYWIVLDEIGAWGWSGEFTNPNVLDGTAWSVNIQRNGHGLAAAGSNAYPPDGRSESGLYDRFCIAVEALLGGLAFR